MECAACDNSVAIGPLFWGKVTFLCECKINDTPINMFILGYKPEDHESFLLVLESILDDGLISDWLAKYDTIVK